MNFRHKQPKRRLGRIDARRNDASSSSSSSSPFSSTGNATPPMVTRSLEFGDNKRSFRVEGIDGEFELICRSLGLSGPEDFSIPESAWEAMRMRSSSDVFPMSTIHRSQSPPPPELDDDYDVSKQVEEDLDQLEVGVLESRNDGDEEEVQDVVEVVVTTSEIVGNGGGIVGARPLQMAPPPSILRRHFDDGSSTWDLLKGLATEDEEQKQEDQKTLEAIIVAGEMGDTISNGNELVQEIAVGFTESCSVSSSYDGDHSNVATPTTSPPNVRFRQIIRGWMKGQLLGRGSYGSVYEAISV